MPFQKNKTNRDCYAYPAVALNGILNDLNVMEFNASIGLDYYIHNLLRSNDPNQKIMGYLSVVFWGFYSGQAGVITEPRALGKVDLALNGRDRVVNSQEQRMRGIFDHGVQVIADYIDSAIFHIEHDRYSEALAALNNLPQLKIAFSSKVCAFIDPRKCGVIDSVIVEKYPNFGFSTGDGGIVTDTVNNRALYNDYCHYLQNQSNKINHHPSDFRWQDRDGSLHNWRALDVERSMY